MLEDGALDRDLEEPLAHWRAHGWARLGRVANGAALEAMRARIDAIMLGEVAYEGIFFQKDTATGRYDDLTFGRGWEGPSLEYRKVEKLEKDPIFRAWIENPLYARIARARLGDAVALYRAVLFTKSARGGTLPKARTTQAMVSTLTTTAPAAPTTRLSGLACGTRNDFRVPPGQSTVRALSSQSNAMPSPT